MGEGEEEERGRLVKVRVGQTFWLMRIMAMSLREVNFLKVCSISLTAVSVNKR